MSYLSALRLHFAGQFVADVPTIDNKLANHDRASKGNAIPDNDPDAGFNPRGPGKFNFQGCTVRSAFYQDGTAANNDLVIGMSVMDAGAGPAAKIVDLDPQETSKPMIYGLTLRLLDAANNVVLRGQFESAAARDLWARCPGAGGFTSSGGAMFQSVLTDLRWPNPAVSSSQKTLAGSSFLYQLYQVAANGGKLSIKFNLDAFFQQNLGRIVGTLGPFKYGEPHHFIRGRHMLAPLNPNGTPQNSIFHTVAVLDSARKSVLVDLGNSLPTDAVALPSAHSSGTLTDLGQVNLVYDKLSNNGNLIQRVSLQQINYTQPNWYESSAGVIDVPVTQTQFDDLQKAPLGVTSQQPNAAAVLAVTEAPGGLFVQSETAVSRLDPTYTSTKKKKIKLLVTEYGNPRAGARLVMQISAPGPVAGLSTDPSAITASNGWATVELRADATVDPAGQQRQFMHSGIFRVRCALDQTNLSDTISVLVWELFKPEAGNPTWWGTVQPIFQTYSILFPFMKNIVDLSDYNQVCAKRKDIIAVLSLSDEDPHQMPVTRDLAPSGRKAILKWLKHLGPDGNPLLGTPPTN
jgi:hypothetical protein